MLRWPVMFALLVFAAIAVAQVQPVGVCYDNTRGQSFYFFPNAWMQQVGNPGNQGQAVRDPSGLMFMRVPAVNPTQQAFFIDWQANVIEVTLNMPPRLIGQCQFNAQVIPNNPFPQQYAQPAMASWGVRTQGDTVQALPQAYANPQQRYVAPLYATADTAQQCVHAASDEDEFADCMLGKMLDPQRRAVYECAKNSNDSVQASLCTLSAVGGQQERRAAQQLGACYDQHGEQWDQYALCMAGQNVGDERAARLLGCLKSQVQDEGQATVMGTAICYGAGSFQLNPELQIAVECAATSGGEPMTFAGCAGGQLTARELKKCVEQGFGEGGCFGPNNEIVKALRQVGFDMNDALGPNNDLVKAWNNGVSDLQNGPGPNNDALRVFENIGNDITRGPGPNNDVVKAIDKVIPGFRDIF